MNRAHANKAFRTTIDEILGCLTADRDARIIRTRSGVCFVVMDDAGNGEFERAVSDDEGAKLIAEGYCRDDR